MRWLVVASIALACAIPMRVEAQSVELAAPAPYATNHAIVGLGMAIWTTTYLPAVLIGAFAGLQFSSCGGGLDSVFEIPFGALAGGIVLQSCNGPSSYVAFGYAFGVGQIVGLLVAVLGAAVFRRPVFSADTRWTQSGFAVDF